MPERIGRAGEPVRVLAFSGGAYDTIPQIGVAHALLASDACRPDVVVGVSMGAVNAVAVAEILGAGREDPDPAGARAAQVTKLLDVVEAYASVQRELLQDLVPDIYQVDARRPLAAPELPLQAPEERGQREQAIAAKAGLIHLVNDILRLGVTVATLARVARLALGWRASSEMRAGPRWRERARTVGRAWWLAGQNLPCLAPALVKVTRNVTVDFLRRLRLPRENGRDAATLIFSGGPLLARVAGPAVDAACLLGLGALWLLPLALLVVLGVALASAAGLPVGAVGGRAIADHAVWILLGSSAVLALAVAGLMVVRRHADGLGHRLFRYYQIANGWFDPHPLRERLIRLFDPEYYGTVDINDVVSSILRDGSRVPSRPRPRRKTLGGYAQGADGVHVGVVAARVDTPQLDVLADGVPVVDALMVGTALPPFFEAQQDRGKWYVDAALVAREPTRALIPFLRDRLHPQASDVRIYSVVTLPLGRGELPGRIRRAYTRLVDIALRSLDLQRFRDAALDRRVTHLYSTALDQAGPALQRHGGQDFVRAWIYPIEPDAPTRLSARLFLTQSDDRRRAMILEAVADGCRSTLEAMMPAAVAAVAGPGDSAPCRAVVSHHTGGPLPLAESGESPGAGLRQVCERCALHRSARRGSPERGAQRLRVLKARLGSWPPWSTRAACGPEGHVGAPATEISAHDEAVRLSLSRRAERQEVGTSAGGTPIRPWPRPREGQSLASRPVVSLLFAGGVFRGVYLLGVVNALTEIGLFPDLIAGSSVGTITAAMTASVFAAPAAGRRAAVAKLVSAFLALDRLVMTDRCAEFARGLTLRAAAADFAPRHLDELFRAFDRPATAAFSKQARRTLAGLERLFYTSPFEVAAIARAFRAGRKADAIRLLNRSVQEFLERGGVGLEVLGAAPLAALIDHYVTRPHVPAGQPSGAAPLHLFAGNDIQFLATTTNLSRGLLEYLLGDPLTAPERRASLVETLLASSAFPAVFRPRWAYEVMPLGGARDQFVDGGVMDNLPLDAVAHFLNEAARARLIAHRPGNGAGPVPHLVFTASLEVALEDLTPGEAARRVESWRATYERASKLGYNTKLDGYRELQRDLRTIRTARAAPIAGQHGADLLDLEVVDVKPAWLCDTFAFHPMLGFRRSEQAASIAHGCASTLRRFQEVQANPATAHWVDAWNISTAELQGQDGAAPSRPAARAPGRCFFRPDAECPFSRGALLRTQAGDPTLTDDIVTHVSAIHRACGDPHTHEGRRPGASA